MGSINSDRTAGSPYPSFSSLRRSLRTRSTWGFAAAPPDVRHRLPRPTKCKILMPPRRVLINETGQNMLVNHALLRCVEIIPGHPMWEARLDMGTGRNPLEWEPGVNLEDIEQQQKEKATPKGAGTTIFLTELPKTSPPALDRYYISSDSSNY